MNDTMIDLIKGYLFKKDVLEANKRMLLIVRDGLERHTLEDEVRILEIELAETSRLLKKASKHSDKLDYKIFYYHYVKGYSLNATAKKYNFDRSAVVKKCRKIRRLLEK